MTNFVFGHGMLIFKTRAMAAKREITTPLENEHRYLSNIHRRTRVWRSIPATKGDPAGVTIADAVAVVGDSQNTTPSSGQSQFVAMVGIRHAF